MIKQIEEAQYDTKLGWKPPALWLKHGFLAGAVHTERRCRITGNIMPTYLSFFNAFKCFYEGEAMTMTEFFYFDIHSLPPPK